MYSRGFLLQLVVCLSVAYGQQLPVVINTWPFVDANYKGRLYAHILDLRELGSYESVRNMQ